MIDPDTLWAVNAAGWAYTLYLLYRARKRRDFWREQFRAVIEPPRRND